MRLNSKEIEIIEHSVTTVDPNAIVYLFGSRTDDLARGGDIDLLIESHHMNAKKKRDLRDQLFHQLGSQKVDLFVTEDYSEPFARIAKSRGIRL